jgi:hypothetical protein
MLRTPCRVPTQGAGVNMDLPLNSRKQYWQSLLRQQPVPDPRLYPGLVDELRAGLRDALREIPDPCGVQPCGAQTQDRWRGACTPQRERVGKC